MKKRTYSLPVLAVGISSAILLASPAQAAFVLLENFEALTIGALGGQNGWVSNANDTTTFINVAADPGLQGAGNVFSTQSANLFNTSGLSTVNSGAYKALATALAENTTGTLFLRYRFDSGDQNFSFGLAGTDTPLLTSFNDFKVQGNQNNALDNLRVRDLGAFDPVALAQPENTWFNVWFVADTTNTAAPLASGSFTVYANSVPLAPGTGSQLTGTDAQSVFSFRNTNTTQTALASFLLRTGGSNATDTAQIGNLYVDDIFIDTEGSNLTNPLIPEPTTIGLLGLSAVAFGFRRYRRSK